MKKVSARRHWIYPLDIREGTGWEATFGTRNDSRTFLVRPANLTPKNPRGNLYASWGVSTSFRKVPVDDYVWFYGGWNERQILAVGTVETPPTPTTNDPRYVDYSHSYVVWIKIDNALTLRLQEVAHMIKYSDFRQWVPGAVREASPTTRRVLQRFLGRRGSPSATDEVVRRARVEVYQRLGQAEFRASVLSAYASRCAISGVSQPEALVAAHIKPVSAGGRHSTKNGLLLRADLHNLFDAYLIAIDSNFRVRVSTRVVDGAIRKLEGVRVGLPADQNSRPNPAILRWHFQNYLRTQ